ncbi:MAG: hypothetical protein JST82_05335 [Bacteroidetes bacterium]|nr:hypothetical protein [Bacteroidota bacterium]
MKQLFIIMMLVLIAAAAKAQNASGNAAQTANLELSDAIDISFLSANTINMQFNTVNDFANGVESGEHTILVRSNKKFNVRVRALASKFAYAGTSSDPHMSVNPVLKLKVVNNNTGGTVTSGFNNYKTPPTNAGTKIINQGQPGGNNTFSVKYFANPGFNYPAGTYSVDIVYTATQA